MTNLDIYYSDACNANCRYCIMREQNHTSNTAICNALQNGNFYLNIKPHLNSKVVSLGIWGREPSINGQYFKNFITNILFSSPYIKYVMIPTNGQSETFYEDFILPLFEYCNRHKRKLILMIQFSLDGPEDIHDKYCGKGSLNRVMYTIRKICTTFPFENNFLRLRLSTKSTLRAYELLNYDPEKWGSSMFILNGMINKFFTRYPQDCQVGRQEITVEVPGDYQAEHGKALCNWKSFYHLQSTKPITCAAGNESKTIDYLGNLYDCHLLKNKDINLDILRAQFDITMDKLVKRNEVIEQDKDKLFNAITSIYCWGAASTELDSYIRLLGNGYLLE